MSRWPGRRARSRPPPPDSSGSSPNVSPIRDHHGLRGMSTFGPSTMLCVSRAPRRRPPAPSGAPRRVPRGRDRDAHRESGRRPGAKRTPGPMSAVRNSGIPSRGIAALKRRPSAAGDRPSSARPSPPASSPARSRHALLGRQRRVHPRLARLCARATPTGKVRTASTRSAMPRTAHVRPDTVANDSSSLARSPRRSAAKVPKAGISAGPGTHRPIRIASPTESDPLSLPRRRADPIPRPLAGAVRRVSEARTPRARRRRTRRRSCSRGPIVRRIDERRSGQDRRIALQRAPCEPTGSRARRRG